MPIPIVVKRLVELSELGGMPLEWVVRILQTQLIPKKDYTIWPEMEADDGKQG